MGANHLHTDKKMNWDSIIPKHMLIIIIFQPVFGLALCVKSMWKEVGKYFFHIMSMKTMTNRVIRGSSFKNT